MKPRILSTFFLFMVMLIPDVRAEEKSAPDLVTTGSGIRVKRVMFMNWEVYNIIHKMAVVPATPTAQAIINANVDKEFTLTLLRDLDGKQVADAIRDAFEMNGYKNRAKINNLLKVLKGNIRKGDKLIVKYTSEDQATSFIFRDTISTETGEEFMRATWSCWFGKIDQPALTRFLMSDIKTDK